MLAPLVVLVMVASQTPSQTTAPAPAEPKAALEHGPVDLWPRLTLSLAAEFPTGIGIHVEVNILEGVGVEGGINAPGILPGAYSIGGFWRPFAIDRPGFDLRIGAGAQVFAFYDEVTFLPFSIPEGLAVLSAQATAAWRPTTDLPFGLFAGARLGAGPAFSFAGSGVEPGLLAALHVGIVAF